MSERVEIIAAELATLRLEPGDRLALMVDHPISRDVHERLSEVLEQWAAGVPVLVLEPGARLVVVREEVSGEEENPADIAG